MSGWVSSPRMVIVPPSSSSTPQTTTGAVSAASRKSNRIVFSSLPIAVRSSATPERVLRPLPTKSKDLDSPAVPSLNRVPLAMYGRVREVSLSPDSVVVPPPRYLGVNLIPRFPIALNRTASPEMETLKDSARPARFAEDNVPKGYNVSVILRSAPQSSNSKLVSNLVSSESKVLKNLVSV